MEPSSSASSALLKAAKNEDEEDEANGRRVLQKRCRIFKKNIYKAKRLMRGVFDLQYTPFDL
jgi:hypothetical protein